MVPPAYSQQKKAPTGEPIGTLKFWLIESLAGRSGRRNRTKRQTRKNCMKKQNPKNAEPVAIADALDGFEKLYLNVADKDEIRQLVWAEPQLFLLPFCIPQRNSDFRNKPIRIAETVKVDGIIKERVFKVIPDPDYGLPDLFDFEVMIVIYQLAGSQRQSCNLEPLELPSLRSFLELMGRPGDGKYVAMLKRSLKRLASTNCVSEGFFYSKPRDFYLIESFQFLTAAHIVGEDDRNGGRFERTTIKLHPFIQENLKSNFRTLIDFDFIRMLKTDIAKPLSLHLAYRFHKQGVVWEADYTWLADRLALKQQQDLKRAKEQMKAALDELKRTTFIEEYKWLPNWRLQFIAGPAYAKQHAERVQAKDAWLEHAKREATSIAVLEPRTLLEAARKEAFDPLAALCTDYAAHGWTPSVALKAKQKQLSEAELHAESIKRGHTLRIVGCMTTA